METHDDTQTPESIEQGIEKTRSAMANTLDDLQRRLSSGNLIDQAVAYFDRRSGRMGTEIVNTVRDHPVPAALAGIGVAWLVAAGWRAAEETSPGQGGSSPGGHGDSAWGRSSLRASTEVGYGGYGGTDPGSASSSSPEYSLGERAFTERRLGNDRRSGNAATTTSQGWGQAGSGVKEKAGRIGQQLSHGMEQAREKVSETAGEMREKAGRLGEKASRQAHDVGARVQQRYDYMLREQPWVLAGLGVAAGAALAAALPRTRQENRLMGETRDRLVETARETGQEMASAAGADTGHHGSDWSGLQSSGGATTSRAPEESAGNRSSIGTAGWTTPEPGSTSGTASSLKGETIAPSSGGACEPGH